MLKPRSSRNAEADLGEVVVEIDTTTITPEQIAKLYPKANPKLIAHLQAVHRELMTALSVARGRGVGASLAVAVHAVDLAILSALRAHSLKQERLILRDTIAAWVMLTGEGTEAAVDSANGLGSLGRMAQKIVARWKPEYADGTESKDAAKKQLVIDIVSQHLRWLLPRAPDGRLVEEALGGPRAAHYPRTSIESLAVLLESGALSIDAASEENKASALERAVAKHKKSVRSRLPAGGR